MKLVDVLRRPRSWSLSAGLAARVAGFVTSFFIARILGGLALGHYLSILNTASSTIQPLSQVLGNNATLLAAQAQRDSDSNVRTAMWANLLVAVVVATVSFVAFLALVHLVSRGLPPVLHLSRLEVLAGAAIVFGQLSGAVLLGVLFGTDRFAAAAIVTVVVSVFTAISVLPAIVLFGLNGAFAMVIMASATLPLALAVATLRFARYERGAAFRPAVVRAINQLCVSLPSVARAGVGAAAYWFCTIFLVQQSFGLAGVGVVLVALQWMTFILMAATSWRGVSMKLLADAVALDQNAVGVTVRALLRHDVAVTSAAGTFVFVCASWIETAYGLEGSGLVSLLRIAAVCAVVNAFNGVFEKLLLSVNRQGLWFSFSAIGFAVQVAVTVAFIESGVFVAALGLLAGATVLTVLCALRFRSIILVNRQGS